jgi:hypothetical protein
MILQMRSNIYYPTNAATQEYIIQYNYEDHENGEEEYFKTSFFLVLSST